MKQVITNRILWVDMLKGLLLLLTCSSHFMERPSVIDKVMEYVPTYYIMDSE